MTFGDLLEALGLAVAAASAYLQWGLTAGLAALAVALLYEGQCFGSTNMPRPHPLTSTRRIVGKLLQKRLRRTDPANNPTQ